MTRLPLALLSLALAAPLAAHAQKKYDPGASDTEICFPSSSQPRGVEKARRRPSGLASVSVTWISILLSTVRK
jgi:hypothetical protein